ncbi:MAG TPA: hypothetical protein VMF06_03035 [Candidatus Limnocylindria bacterium]|nr:hypothetical protein [Candidatus Limnocylindria bacterium]
MTGCRNSPSQSFLQAGKAPLAEGALYRQAETVVLDTDREKARECTTRRVIKTELFKAPEITAASHATVGVGSMSGMGTPDSYYLSPDQRYSEFVEKWTLDRCGQEVTYLVTFTPQHSFSGGTVVTAVPGP